MQYQISPFIKKLLSPIAIVWEKIYQVRRRLYHAQFFTQHQFNVPVVSVGNVTFGGTGKTPFIIFLSNYFHHHALKPAVLMRGYKGNLESKSGLIHEGKTFKVNPYDFGDEAQLMAQKLPFGAVIVGRNRWMNFKYYYEQVKPNVVLLDDGHQHLKIYRDLNIVMFDCTLPLSQLKVAPLGYLREGMTSLCDSDLIVISRADQVDEMQKNALKSTIIPYLKQNTPIVEIYYKTKSIVRIDQEVVLKPTDLKDKKVVLACAIASPRSFFRLVESFGAQIVHQEVFADHYYFQKDDINRLLSIAEQKDAIILVSEKDIGKIRNLGINPKIFHLEIEVEFLHGRKEFEDIIQQKILSHL